MLKRQFTDKNIALADDKRRDVTLGRDVPSQPLHRASVTFIRCYDTGRSCDLRSFQFFICIHLHMCLSIYIIGLVLEV